MAFPFSGFHGFSEAFLGPVDRGICIGIGQVGHGYMDSRALC